MAGKATDDQLVEGYTTIGATATGQKYKMSVRVVQSRIRGIEGKRDVKLLSGTKPGGHLQDRGPPEDTVLNATVRDGCVLIFSDSHYWQYVSTAHRALVMFAEKYKPKMIVANGDIVDGATNGRHPPIGWEGAPSVLEEIQYAQLRLAEITKAAPKGTRYAWCLGNHDLRFENRLAHVAPEYEGVKGTRLKDHFPTCWEPCWALTINDDVLIKHRYKSGEHSTKTNTIKAGMNVFTGHDHALRVTPFTDWTRTRWGGNSGTLAEPRGPQFANYTEANPLDHRSGFLMLTFRDGKLMWPEQIWAREVGVVDFRGELINV